MPTTSPRVSRPIPARQRRSLRQSTNTINRAEQEWDSRAQLMSALWVEGHSLDSIAEAAGITREGARKSILRWRRRTGWQPEG